MSVDNDSLSHLILVCGSENLRHLVENVPSDEWGFRPISKREVKAWEPEIYDLTLKAVEIFTIENYELEYSLVFDWERRDQED
jgi:hypothetical protein